MKLLILALLPLFACGHKDKSNSAERQFQDFHRGYEREWSRQRSRGYHNRRDAPLDQEPRINLEKRLVPYTDGNETFTGYVAYDKGSKDPRPVVVIVHDWNGRDEFENGKAEALAKLGYVGFALDLYGKTGSTPEENQALMKPFRDNRQFLLKRLQLALNETKKIDVVDQNKVRVLCVCA